MSIQTLAKRFGNLVVDHSPTLLTSLGVAGVLSTAVLTARATAESVRRTDEYLEERGDEIYEDKVEFVKEMIILNWRSYIAPVSVGVVTATCIISANTISSRRNAALMSAFTLTETALRDYQSKTLETVGEKKELEIREAVSEEQMHRQKAPAGFFSEEGLEDGLERFHDTLTGRYFRSSVELVRKAQNDVNTEAINGMGGVSHNYFYEQLGLDPVDSGDILGWNTEHQIEVVFLPSMTESGKPCISLQYREHPKSNFRQVF